MRRRRGFTVLEFAIALAIAGIVVSSAASMAVALSKSMRYEERRAQVDTDARRLVDFLIGNAQATGGGVVRPWMALWLEEDCSARNGLPGCAGSDRLTLLDVDTNRASCSITALSDTELTVPPPDSTSKCCFDWSGSVVEGPPNQYDNTMLLFVRGDRWVMRKAVAKVASTTECKITLADVNPLDAEETTPAVGRGDGEREPLSLADLVGGTAVPVRPRTLFVDHAEHRMMEWFDLDLDGTAEGDEPAELRVVFPGVYDFQAATTYDGAPEDGRLLLGPSTTDEYLGNVADDALPATVRDDHLRGVSFGVITGVRAVDAPVRSEKVLNGPTLTTSGALSGVLLRKAVGYAMLRNLLVFF
jgi:prepilin-type N-terminal cleavage/methylation domain-containing protein